MSEEPELRAQRGVYSISVTSELSGVSQQTLRLYEQRGLVKPSRTAGGTRRYSDDDLVRLQRIAELVEAGVNIAGIGRILDLEHRNVELESDNIALNLDKAGSGRDQGLGGGGIGNQLVDDVGEQPPLL